MAYFLKRTRLKGRTYLAICESFYSPEKKGTAHKTYQSLGSLETHLANGMQDPIAHFQAQVDLLNKERKKDSIKQISNRSPSLYLGYFPLKSVLAKLGVQKYINFFNMTTDFEFDLFELISSLIFARSVHPCSKSRTFHEVLPSLYEPYDYSYDQLLDGLAFIGNDYEKFVEIFTVQVHKKYKLETDKTYFDCTNFYFEIDREDDFRRKGPSKENQKGPLVGLGLLLDKNQIPIGMRMYPGNKSEKPVIREVIAKLKEQNNIKGRTIHVADKGVNCAQNIAFTKQNGDGYLFSKSVKGLPAREKDWVLHDEGFQEVKDKRGRVLYKYKSCIDKFPYKIEHNGKDITVLLTEKRLLTYNPSLAVKKRYEINRMVERAHQLTLSQAKKDDYGDCAKYVTFTDSEGKKAQVSINEKAIKKDLAFAGYNLLVTSEINMKDQDIYSTYHNLWRIEESFKIMKSDLDARPVFVQKEETIKGHFLICYLTVLLERIFQFKLMGDRYSASEVFAFIKGFKVTKAERNYINTSIRSDLIEEMADIFKLPLTNYYLTESQIKSILNYKL